MAEAALAHKVRNPIEAALPAHGPVRTPAPAHGRLGELSGPERVDNRRPDCSVRWDDGHPPKPVGERMILTAEKWRFVPIRECERDMRGGFTKNRSRRFTKPLSPISLPLNQLRPYSRVRRCRSGKSEVDGSDPPILPPGSPSRRALFSHAPHRRGGRRPIYGIVLLSI